MKGEWDYTDAEIVQADDSTKVCHSYQTACHEYAIGFSVPFFWMATLCAYAILWQQHLPEQIYYLASVFFVFSSFAGLTITLIAYLAPVKFYELLEGEN